MNEGDDCRFSFDTDERYHDICNGNVSCKEPADRQGTPDFCKNDGDYGGHSNYMYIDYDCIDRKFFYHLLHDR